MVFDASPPYSVNRGLDLCLHTADQFAVGVDESLLGFDLGDDGALGVQRGQRNRNSFENARINFWHASSCSDCVANQVAPDGLTLEGAKQEMPEHLSLVGAHANHEIWIDVTPDILIKNGCGPHQLAGISTLQINVVALTATSGIFWDVLIEEFGSGEIQCS